jgi:hypothetical protein
MSIGIRGKPSLDQKLKATSGRSSKTTNPTTSDSDQDEDPKPEKKEEYHPQPVDAEHDKFEK